MILNAAGADKKDCFLVTFELFIHKQVMVSLNMNEYAFNKGDREFILGLYHRLWVFD